ncbi:LytR/AlgR family response regulator transcription factor [Xylocopilactobacillus apicola]|uniref:DNA-binding response regulator n=1 Tax=Xylocopilactobacillus apicola TaxID=2932184 RepID=A0AAU9CZK1_9LACO|nr:response regulator transcription factor [Xylocopilactobacillus apicola]BDR57861.1 DNA-binding response regulator [Xylocopilactobacillus apicola]
MTKIFICDDQPTHLGAVKKIVENGILFAEHPFNIELATTDPNEIVQHLGNNEMAVYFLDIDLNHEEYDGLKLAMKIREKDPFGFLIFITSHLEFGMVTFEYKLGAFDYIMKTPDLELFKERILAALRAVVERTTTNSEVNRIKLKTDYEDRYLSVEDLIMLEIVGNHRLQITTKDQVTECNGTLKKVKSELPNYFFSCNRGIVINLKEVAAQKLETVVMTNGSIVQCSGRQMKELKKRLGKT